MVDWAKDGHEAFSLAEASFSGLRPDYDLILMDIRMPELDGLEATRRIRTLEGTLGRVPRRIIALTANAQREDEEAAKQAGLDGFLAKPFDRKDLAALIELPEPQTDGAPRRSAQRGLVRWHTLRAACLLVACTNDPARKTHGGLPAQLLDGCQAKNRLPPEYLRWAAPRS